jgi:long-chain acyl-CoA synthetase
VNQSEPENLPMTVTGLLQRTALHQPDAPYLLMRAGDRVAHLTFREVAERARLEAGGLLSAGIAPGDRVALLAENRPSWVTTYFAILLAGATVVPVDSLMSPAEILGVLKLAKARALFTTRKFAESLSVLPEATILPQIFLLDDPLDSGFAVLPRSENANLPAVQPTDTAAILFTSGTMGFSKGIVLSHANLCTDVNAFVSAGIIEPTDNFHLLLPLHHTFSSTVNMLGALAIGARATFAVSYKSREILDDVRIAEVTMLVAVPQVFEMLMQGIKRGIAEAPRLRRFLFGISWFIVGILSRAGLHAGKFVFRSLRERAGLGSLRRMIAGGAALPPEVNIFFERLGFTLLQGYGLTETSPVLSVNLPKCNRIGSVGPPLPTVEFRIDQSNEGDDGEICVRGPMVMQGYFENPEATADVLKDGWLHTGDAGYLDRYGYLHITGRIKSVIVTGGGKNIHPEEIEAQLTSSPYVLESLVMGVERKRGAGEELMAILVPDKAAVGTARDRGENVDITEAVRKVIENYNRSVPAYRRIRQWQLQDEELAKTSTRKIKRYLHRKFIS